MNDSLGKIFSILIAAILMVYLPVMAMGERTKTAAQLYLLTEETELIDSVCNVGFLNQNMYEQFQNRILRLPGIYEVKITIERKELQYEDEKVSYVSRFWDTDEIEEILRNEELFALYRNDFIRIWVTRKDVRQSFWPGMDQTVNVFYGGTVKYEAY